MFRVCTAKCRAHAKRWSVQLAHLTLVSSCVVPQVLVDGEVTAHRPDLGPLTITL